MKLAVLTLKAKIIIAAAAAAVTAATVGTVIFLLSNDDSYRVIKVFETQGQNNTVERDSAGKLEAYSGMNLQNGDLVSTGSQSNMRLSLDGDKYILMDQDSELKLVAENTAKDSKTLIELQKGEILNEITEPLSDNSTYEVNTPKATMVVRGTSFYVKTQALENGSDMTDLEVIHGKVAVRLYDEKGNKKGEEVIVQEGYKVTIVIDPNENTDNSPDVDGNAYFVYRTDDGGFIPCGISDPAPYKTDFSLLSDLIKKTALTSDDSGLLLLDEDIVKILKGEVEDDQPEEQTASTTAAETTEVPVTTTSESITTTPALSEETVTTQLQQPVTTTPQTVVTTAPVTSTPPTTVATVPETTSETVTAAPPAATAPVTTGSAVTSDQTTPPTSAAVTPTETTATTVTTTTTTTTTTSAAETTTETTTETTIPEPEFAEVVFADGDGNAVYRKEVEIGSAIGALPAVPAVPGYTGKWTIDGAEIPEGYTVTDDVTVTAVYTINKYTVTFESAEDVDLPEDLTLEYNTVLSEKLPDVPDKTGYTGVWTIDGAEVLDTYKVTDDITVTAVYTINKYTVTFDSAEDVNLPDPLTLEYNTVLSSKLPDVPDKTGYTGIWTIDGAEVSDTYKVTGDVTVTAVYTINKYTVTFDSAEDVELPENLTLEYNTPLSEKLPAVPDKTGYTGKWTINGAEVPDNYTVTDDVTVTAVYTINKYTVTFDSAEDVELPENFTLEYGTPLAEKLPDVPEKENYTGKWTIDGAEIPENYTVTDDVTVTAVYTINKYTVTFETDADGVDMPEKVTVEHGSALADVLGNVPEKPYYTGKWVIDGNAIPADYIVTGDVTVTAVYTHIKVRFYVEYIGGYTDDYMMSGSDDPAANFYFATDSSLTFDYDMSAAELNEKIKYDVESFTRYDIGKVVYSSVPEDPENILDINDLPEFQEGMLLSDLAGDYQYEDQYYSCLTFYFVPNWTVHKVTLHDLDGSLMQEFNVLDNSRVAPPEAPNGATWIHMQEDGSCFKFYTDNGYYRDEELYCGYNVEAFNYSNGEWNTVAGFYKKAGDTLTDDDFKLLSEFCEWESMIGVAGYVTEPVVNADEVTGLVSSGMTVDKDIKLYAVKASIDYTKADGSSGTLYWLGEGSIVEALNALQTEGHEWHFDDESGELVDEDSFGSRYYGEIDPVSPQTAARFKAVESQLNAAQLAYTTFKLGTEAFNFGKE